jgi:hypothetical protein
MAGEDSGLPREALPGAVHLTALFEEFDDDLAIEQSVPGQENLARRSFSKRLQDLVSLGSQKGK